MDHFTNHAGIRGKYYYAFKLITKLGFLIVNYYYGELDYIVYFPPLFPLQFTVHCVWCSIL